MISIHPIELLEEQLLDVARMLKHPDILQSRVAK